VRYRKTATTFIGRSSWNNNRIAVIVGSLRKDSFQSRVMANAVVKLAPSDLLVQAGANRRLRSTTRTNDANPAESVKRLKGEIAASRGLLFVNGRIQPFDPGC